MKYGKFVLLIAVIYIITSIFSMISAQESDHWTLADYRAFKIEQIKKDIRKMNVKIEELFPGVEVKEEETKECPGCCMCKFREPFNPDDLEYEYNPDDLLNNWYAIPPIPAVDENYNFKRK